MKAYRLGHQVVVVEGIERAALLNLERQQLHRIPNKLLGFLRNGNATDDYESGRWLDYLVSSGFVQHAHPTLWKAYSDDSSVPRLPKLHTISVEFDPRHVAVYTEWICASSIPPRHLSLYSPDGYLRNAHRFAKQICERTPLRSFELIKTSKGSPENTWVFEASGKLLGSRVKTRTHLLSHITITGTVYSLLTFYGETAGSLHITDELELLPHREERFFKLGRVDTQSVDEVLGGARYLEYISASKEKRDICKGCEFRRCCLRPNVNRRQSLDLLSGPSDCTYNPSLVDPQNHLFEIS